MMLLWQPSTALTKFWQFEWRPLRKTAIQMMNQTMKKPNPPSQLPFRPRHQYQELSPSQIHMTKITTLLVITHEKGTSHIIERFGDWDQLLAIPWGFFIYHFSPDSCPTMQGRWPISKPCCYIGRFSPQVQWGEIQVARCKFQQIYCCTLLGKDAPMDYSLVLAGYCLSFLLGEWGSLAGQIQQL